MDDLDELQTEGEYAKKRKCSKRTVQRERATGTGCPYIKIGRAVRYRRRDIDEFIEKHVRQSTSEGVMPEQAGRRVKDTAAAARTVDFAQHSGSVTNPRDQVGLDTATNSPTSDCLHVAQVSGPPSGCRKREA